MRAHANAQQPPSARSPWRAASLHLARVHAHPAACPLPRRAVILTTNSWVGGKNVFLGALYLATGGVCLLIALFFFAGYNLGEPRPLPPKVRLRRALQRLPPAPVTPGAALCGTAAPPPRLPSAQFPAHRAQA